MKCTPFVFKADSGLSGAGLRKALVTLTWRFYFISAGSPFKFTISATMSVSVLKLPPMMICIDLYASNIITFFSSFSLHGVIVTEVSYFVCAWRCDPRECHGNIVSWYLYNLETFKATLDISRNRVHLESHWLASVLDIVALATSYQPLCSRWWFDGVFTARQRYSSRQVRPGPALFHAAGIPRYVVVTVRNCLPSLAYSLVRARPHA